MTNSAVTITGYTGPGGAADIPAMIDGLPVTSIGASAFAQSSLTSVTIPDSVTNIGDSAFLGCASLTNVSIPDGVGRIGNQVFAGSGLRSMAIPGSVTSIGGQAFAGCAKLGSVTIPDSVTNIADYAFSTCGLTNVVIPGSVPGIGYQEFYSCPKLASVTISEGVGSIAGQAFENCGNLARLAIPDSVTNIAAFAFDNCGGLRSVTIPGGVAAIGGSAFIKCAGLTNVTILNSAVSASEFAGCASLVSVTLTNSLASIGDEAFFNLTNLAALYFLGNAPSLGAQVFQFDSRAIAYYVPGATGWDQFGGGIPVALLNSPPGLARQPQSQTIVAGGNVTLAVVATITAPPSYQWQFDNTSLPGATGPTLALANVHSNQAGNYTVVLSNASGSITSEVAALTVLPALSVAWPNPAPITYGTALSSAQLDATANVPGTFAYTPPLGAVPPAGSRQSLGLTFTPADSADYQPFTTNVAITVNPAPLTVTAASYVRTYGAPNPAFAVAVAGFVNGDGLAAVSGQPAFGTLATADSNAGSYAITPSLGTLRSSNYSFSTFVNGNLTVTPAKLSVMANSFSRGYGAANPVFSATVTGFVNGDTVASVTGQPAFVSAAGIGSPVGQYPVLPTLGTLSATNYTFDIFREGALTVSPALLSVTANDASRPYGAANPVFAGSLVGVMNGDNIAAVFASAADQATAAGTYINSIAPQLVDPSGRASNYTVTTNKGTLTITPARATIALGGLVQAYNGSPEPVTVATFPAGLSVAVTYNGGSTAPTNPGQYAVGVAVTDPNYTGATNGTLSILNQAIAPTISPLANMETTVNTPTAPQQFHVGEPGVSCLDLLASAHSDNQALAPDANIQILATECARTLVVNPVANQRGTANITVTVTDPDGFSTNSSFLLAVDSTNGLITVQPVDVVVFAGSNATLSVEFSGESAPGYQWQASVAGSWTNLANATNQTLEITNAQPADAGSYRVVVTGAPGESRTSAAATVTVVISPLSLELYPGIALAGKTGVTYQIDYANQLAATNTDWQLLSITNLSRSPVIIIDYGGASIPRRFYRVQPPPSP
jgi:hypothetical protein